MFYNREDELIRKTSVLQQQVNLKTIYYGLFSKSGFTEEMKKLKRPDILLFNLNDLEL